MTNLRKIEYLVLISLLLAGCSTKPHLIFFTNTTIGVEVGSEPQTGNPAKFVVGYKRQEGVIDPLIPDYDFHIKPTNSLPPTKSNDTNLQRSNYQYVRVANDGKANNIATEESNTFVPIQPSVSPSIQTSQLNIIETEMGVAIPQGSKIKAHSVLAKVNFGATNGNNNAQAVQWFATGTAAEELARSDTISEALTGENLAERKRVKLDNAVNSKISNLAVPTQLITIYKLLEDRANNGGNNVEEALEIKESVDKIDSGIFKTQFTIYAFSIDSPNSLKEEKMKLNVGNYFPNSIRFITNLENSYRNAEQALTTNGILFNNEPLTQEKRIEIMEFMKKYPAMHSKAKSEIENNKSLAEMIRFVYSNILTSTMEM
ncbi:hypothetical protein ONV78_04930 [Hahella sp. CR1]|uniref:hypothetical protein n=1 Tax=Hahella sp. CR1 TaxID=2992807 RepID=UPI002441A281|nr:hypothetical protein [Hahella sp. CR1]MDG9667072.1 hypothetical protein [Hahella sp. CR1]